MTEHIAPLRLSLSVDALQSNWRWLAAQSGSAACGAAVKANAYGLGARGAVEHLQNAGCRDFFVASWAEAADVLPMLTDGASLSVLHGVRGDDMAMAAASRARPVLNSIEQVARWRQAGEGHPCDVMVDTGMNRLGLTMDEALSGALDGLPVRTLLSHLASADEDVPQNAEQLARFQALKAGITADRYSLANSAGICLGEDYAFDLTRPGLALYGGIARDACLGHIRQVVFPEMQVLQTRTVKAGAPVGYNATYTPLQDQRIAIINLGYADGYLRCFSGGKGGAHFEGQALKLVGRVSMDLVALAIPEGCAVTEGDWVAIDYDLPATAAASGLSQYELLTGLGARYDRIWG